MTQAEPSATDPQHEVKKLRKQLEDAHIADSVEKMGFTFVEGKFTIGKFVEELRRGREKDSLENLLSRAPRLLKEFLGYRWVRKKDVDRLDYEDADFSSYGWI